MADEPKINPQNGQKVDRPQEKNPSPMAAAVGSLRGGIDAIRRVREASRQHASVKGQVRELSQRLEQDRAELSHREDIERHYGSIVSEQKAESSDANRSLNDANVRLKRIGQDCSKLESELSAMRAEHEESLRPYRELMESTKGRSDDAARSLSDAKRAVKTADQQVADAAKRREQRIAAANKAVDNAQDRIRRVESELANLKADPDTSASALSKMQSELTAEQTHLSTARSEVTRVTDECQRLVDNAQTHLWTQKQSLEVIERQANESKREATGRREEYESLYNAAMDQEKALSDRIAAKKDEQAQAEKDAQAAQKRIAVAQDVLDEANDIHNTPERTIALRQSIQEGEQQLEQLKGNEGQLAESEKSLRAKTRGQRYLVFGVVALLIAIVAVVVWLLTHR